MYSQALSLEPNNKKALVDLGKAQQADKRLQDALASFLKAAILDPSDAEPIFLSGLLYMEAGKTP